MRTGARSSPFELFEAAVSTAAEAELSDLDLEVLARPGTRTPVNVAPGTILIRQSPDDQNAVEYVVQRVSEGRDSLEADNVPCEGDGEGIFAEVDDGPGGTRALRIAGEDGLTLEDTVLLQPRTGQSPASKPPDATAPAPPGAADAPASEPPTLDFAGIERARAAIQQTVSRGMTLTGAVGATSSGNAPDDVRKVQQRLVEVGALRASHGENPAGSAAVPQARLTATIAAIRSFQAQVDFWLARKKVAGAIVRGVVAPGDATAALLDRITVYTTSAPPARFSFRDHVVSSVTRSPAGVIFTGTASPAAIPADKYRALGLTPAQAAALKAVSAHEGNFDAVNTYDRALISAGFIQFAGSRGLPRYLALLKQRQPAKFREQFETLGIDVEPQAAAGASAPPLIVVADPATSMALRGSAAEAAIRDDKRLTAAFVLSGRDRDVQIVQIEAAVRDYVLPALRSTVSWAARQSAPLSALLRSQKGMAALFDRSIQEGLAAARRRFERLLKQMVARGGRDAPIPTVDDLRRREGEIIAELERDLQAAADVAGRITRARAALQTLIGSARAAGASVDHILARPELADARRAVADARTGLSAIVNVTVARDIAVDTAIAAMAAALAAEDTRLKLAPKPASPPDLAAALAESRRALAVAAAPVSTAPVFLARVQRIRRSTLDSGLGEAA